jgi:hypothetical protein
MILVAFLVMQPHMQMAVPLGLPFALQRPG